jgi:hypothetical protein
MHPFRIFILDRLTIDIDRSLHEQLPSKEPVSSILLDNVTSSLPSNNAPTRFHFTEAYLLTAYLLLTLHRGQSI